MSSIKPVNNCKCNKCAKPFNIITVNNGWGRCNACYTLKPVPYIKGK